MAGVNEVSLHATNRRQLPSRVTTTRQRVSDRMSDEDDVFSQTAIAYLHYLFPRSPLTPQPRHYMKLLDDAIEVGDIYQVKRLIEEGKGSVWGETMPLIAPCECGNLRLVEYLLSNGARPNERGAYFDTYTPLHAATGRNHPHVIRALAKKGAFLDATDENGNSSLANAAICGFVECLETLLELGANVRMTSPWNRNTPLHLASYQGNLDCVRLLLDYGSDVDYRNHREETCLMLACDAGQVEVISYLLGAGQANPNFRCLEGNTCLHRVFRTYSTLLCWRVSAHTVDKMCKMFYLLLQYGAHADVPNDNRSTAIDFMIDNPRIGYHQRLSLAHNVLPLRLECLAAQSIASHQLKLDILPYKMIVFVKLHDDPPPKI